MVKIPVYLDQVVDVKDVSNKLSSEFRRIRGDMSLVTTPVGFQETGYLYRLRGVLMFLTCGAVNRYGDLALFGPGSWTDRTCFASRFPLIQNEVGVLNFHAGGTDTQTGTTASTGANYWSCSMPDYWFDHTVYPVLGMGAGVTGTYSIIYERLKL